MLKIEYIFRHDLDSLVHLAYEGDVDLLSRFHIKPNMVLAEAVQKTLSMIDETAHQVDFDYYKVSIDGTPIGYFCTFPKCLYSFGIAMEYRKKEILIEFSDAIKKALGSDIGCILYKNNVRAIKWLEKCNFIAEENEYEDNSITLIYKKES